MFKILVVLAVSLPFVLAQSGTVKAGGQPIPGATVRATQVVNGAPAQRSLVTLTDENGIFRLAGMTPGAWVVEADMFGFDHLRREVQVTAAPASFDLSLQLSARASAPASGRGGTPNANPVPNFPESQPDAATAAAEFAPQVSADSSNESFLVNGTVS